MLAGEDFTDEPGCVCPVVAEFLRTYNDAVDFERRQDLFSVASLVVGTRDGVTGERGRANAILDWWLTSAGVPKVSLRRLLWMLPPRLAARDQEIAHRAARWAAASPSRHRATLSLIERLVGSAPLQAPEAVAEEPRVPVEA